MKNKKILKIIIIFIIVLSFALPILANSNFNVDSFESNSTSTGAKDVIDKTDKIFGTAIAVARIIGVGIAIVILIVISMKYMISSPGDRADIKKNAVPFVIGAVVLFGATGILGIIADFAGIVK